MISTDKQSSKTDKIRMYINRNPKRVFHIFYISLLLVSVAIFLLLISINSIQDNVIDIVIIGLLILIVSAAFTDRWISRKIIQDSMLFVSYATAEESESYKKKQISNIKNRNVMIYLGLAFLAIFINMGLILAENKSSIYEVDLVIIIVFCTTIFFTFKEVSRMRKNTRIIVSRSGAIVYGDLIVWNEKGELAWLREITFNPSSGTTKANLIIDIAWFTRVGNVSRQLIIPISREQEETIPNIVSILEEVKENNKYKKYDDLHS